MIYLILGNLIALIGSILMAYSGLIKNKKKMLYVQTIQTALFVISNLILGGITGALMNALSIIRNILSYNDKLKTLQKIVISILSIILTISFNNLGIIGLSPLISMLAFILFMNVKDIKKYKLLTIFTMIMWAIYDIYIKSYTSLAFDILGIITNTIAIYEITKK